MTHHLIDLDKEFMKEGINIILTREPEQMLSSFHKVIKNPKLKDVGYKDQLSLVHYFEKEFIPFIVIDSKDILQNPKYYLRKVCELADVQFHEEMLLWPAKSRIEDGIWAKHWYSNVHKSTGFMKYKKKTEDFPIELRSLLKECQFYYDELMVRI